MAGKEVKLNEGKNTIGATISTETSQTTPEEGSSRSAARARTLAALSTNEKEAIVSTLKSASDSLKTAVDAADTLIQALVAATMLEADLETAIAAYEALSIQDINSYTRTLISKFRAA